MIWIRNNWYHTTAQWTLPHLRGHAEGTACFRKSTDKLFLLTSTSFLMRIRLGAGPQIYSLTLYFSITKLTHTGYFFTVADNIQNWAMYRKDAVLCTVHCVLSTVYCPLCTVYCVLYCPLSGKSTRRSCTTVSLIIAGYSSKEADSRRYCTGYCHKDNFPRYNSKCSGENEMLRGIFR